MSTRQALAHGFPVTIGGEEWTFSPLSQDDRGALETFLRRQAFEAVHEVRDVLGPDDYAAAVRDLRRDIARGMYNAGGPFFKDAAQNQYFQVEVIFLSLRHRHQQATRDDARRLLETDPAAVEFALKMVSPNAEDLSAEDNPGGEQRPPFRGAQRPAGTAARP